jgi:hypothetical protein
MRESEPLRALIRSTGMIPLPETIPGVMIGNTGKGHFVAMELNRRTCERGRLPPRVIAPSSSYHCLSPGPEALRPVRQSWSRARGLLPPCRSAWLPAPPHRRGRPAGPGARTGALHLSCGVWVGAAEKALCDRISSFVRMVRSPWGRILL